MSRYDTSLYDTHHRERLEIQLVPRPTFLTSRDLLLFAHLRLQLSEDLLCEFSIGSNLSRFAIVGSMQTLQVSPASSLEEGEAAAARTDVVFAA
mmetsp:Transcript_16244/g.45031  ORF Transcript_16244/g.45031 Transcript_16244/m.45031 type:complete len:94 (-) Transcript_16244:113-394(-)